MSNQNMRVGPEFYRIAAHFEKGKQNDPNCRLTASGAALDAYLCPAGVPTIGAGSIRRLDGSPVQMGDTITEAEVFLLAERDAEEAADAVRKIKRPLKQHQFDALTAFTHNLGEGNLQRIVPLIEEGRWEDAAEKMWEYVRAWRTYEGRPYFAALLGLRIRRCAEGLLLNGREWQDVCDADNIGMPRQKPPEWQPNGATKTGIPGRYYDVLLPGATEYTTLEAMSRPLASLTELTLTQKAEPAPSVAPASAGQPVSDPQPQTPAAPASVKEPAKTSPDAAVASKISPNVDTKPAPGPVSGLPGAGPAPPPKPPQGSVVAPVPSSAKPPALPTPVGTKPPSENTKMPEHVPYRIDPTAGLKPMEETERFVGAALMLFGTFARVIMANTTAVTGVGGIIVVAILDMMKSPTNLAILVTVIAMAITGVLWVGAFILDKLGLKIKKRGEQSATQAMY